jgi:uncharacterized membrane protein
MTGEKLMTVKIEKRQRRTPFKTWLRRNFITGVFILIPILGSLFLFAWGFNRITNWGMQILLKWEYFKELYYMHTTAYNIIGRLIIVFVMFGIAVLIGFFTRNFVGRRILRTTEKIFENIPVVSHIFVALKQISKAFVKSDRTLFSYVVLFEYPRKGIYSLGFVMSESFPELERILKKEVLNVFFMTTPNPTTGCFMTVPKEETIRLSMSVEDGLKMVISGGAIVPEYKIEEIAGENFKRPMTLTAPRKEEENKN